MRLKTKLVLAITALVLLISGLLSLVYVSQLLHASVQQSFDTNKMVANQVQLAVRDALETGLKDRKFDPSKPYELRDLVAEAIRGSKPLRVVIDSVNRYSATVYDINIADTTGRILLSSAPENLDKQLPRRRDFTQLQKANSIRLMYELMIGPGKVFDVVLPLDRNNQPFLTIHVGIRTTFLRQEYSWIVEAGTLMGFALGIALLVALLLSNLALRPLEDISRQLDYWTSGAGGNPEEDTAARARQDTAARVSTKIEQIGQRMRNVEEVFSALKDNLDQILGNLQDGILLFTSEGRAVLVSEAARRFLQMERGKVLGMHASEIFDRSTRLGKTLQDAFNSRKPLVKEEVRTETGRRIQASVEFIHDDMGRQGLGALVTLRDLESMEEIESELELSRRMAAIGRLTSGVGHEVKNPINAIVVHLELLRSKVGSESSAARHLEIIQSEIQRLDRVVQTLVDFSKPVELKLLDQDMRQIVSSVLMLASAGLESYSVSVVSQLPNYPVMVKVDADLMKQALLNVVLNGAQAMEDGGELSVRLIEDGRSAIIKVQDHGHGIPEEIRARIFDLYFTTKREGSGIGLAMTYRILQLHNGQLDVESKIGEGSTFTLSVPTSGVTDPRVRGALEANSLVVGERRG